MNFLWIYKRVLSATERGASMYICACVIKSNFSLWGRNKSFPMSQCVCVGYERDYMCDREKKIKRNEEKQSKMKILVFFSSQNSLPRTVRMF